MLTMAFEFMRRNLKEFFADSGNFWLYLLTILLYQAPYIFFLSVIFAQVPSIKGWSFYQLLFIYGFFNTVSGLFYLFFAWTLWFPETYIIGRRLDIILTYPLQPYFYIIFEELGRSIMEIVSVIIGALLMGFALWQLDMVLAPWLIFQIVTSAIAGLCILGGLFTILTAFSFWVKGTAALVSPFMYLLEFARYPMDVYSQGLRVFLTYLVPIGFVGFYPAAVVLQAIPDYFYFLTLLWGGGLLCVGYLFWNIGLRRYESAGN